MIFYVDQSNQYMRGDFFGIYIAVYLIAIFYLLIVTLHIASRYQNKSKTCVYPIIAFLLLSTMIQVLFPSVHVTWLCVSLLSILYYIYCTGMWQQLDGLTGLLNQKSYLNTTASLSKSGTLIVFDIDDFKGVNDHYGHLVGDQCLKEIADSIKNAYSQDGYCYRIGGDEFCVLLDVGADMEKCYADLINELNGRREVLDFLPYVSVGYAPFAAGDDILKVKDTADFNMYRFKRKHKMNGMNND